MLRSPLARALLVGLALVNGACPGGGTGTASDTDPSGSSSGSTTDPDTETESTSEGSTGTETDSSSGSTGTETDSDTETTGPEGTLCEQACALETLCELDGEPDCVLGCEESQGLWDAVGSCGAAYEELLSCIAGLDCAGYKEFVDAEGEAFPCKAELIAVSGEEPDPAPCLLDDVPQVCVDYCASAAACSEEGTEPFCQAQCNLQLGVAANDSPDCAAASEALFACYGAASCEDIELDPKVCAAEEEAAEGACEGA